MSSQLFFSLTKATKYNSTTSALNLKIISFLILIKDNLKKKDNSGEELIKIRIIIINNIKLKWVISP